MSDTIIRLASRDSPMALAQVERVRVLLEDHHPGITVEAVTTTTEGDRWTGALADHGGKALFCKEVDQLVIGGRADVAVHCLKDVPGDSPMPEGTMFAAFRERDSPADCLVHPGGLTFNQLPAGARVGTSSPRRTAQLRRLRDDLDYVPIRGNAGTRLAKLHAGDVDALIMAEAGLVRVGQIAAATDTFSTDDLLPAIGGGIIALQCRVDDAPTRALLAPLDHPATRIEATCERALLRTLRGNCRTAVAAHAMFNGQDVYVHARVYSPDGRRALDASGTAGSGDAAKLGDAVAQRLLDEGARDLIDAATP
ncbi:hydroxymethylbilane synthase [Glycomyces sp. YM15]|uniref:hydroxymethylbilane synthase n=1 Tax=Glycomyces sp. YM15 TaxID=2800446 RepID=UPI001964276E|nr:hydroxymethylbilane synthase [Glycomyces sp. YM15]